MTEQQTTDREKKIAEIQKSAEEARKTKGTWVDGQDYADNVEFLLNELERLEREYAEERAAHNAHVTELIEKEEECRMLREEREKYKEAWRLLAKRGAELADELQSAQQERDKLIEGLRHYADRRNHPPFWLHGDGKLARDILKEIGVTAEWQKSANDMRTTR